MKEVKCDNCGRKLFNTNRTNLGAIAGEATTKELRGMTKEERQDYLTRLKVELENRRK